MKDRYDVVVAGAGAGGCTVAGKLAGAGARVLLVEAGGRARPEDDAFEAVLRWYSHGGFWAPLGNCLMPVPTGRCLGGTTTINSGTCFDTPAELIGAWERESAGELDADRFREHLLQARERLGVRRAPPHTASRSSTLFLEGLRRLGLEGGGLLERAERGCTGRGRCCFVCPEGAKSTADAFLGTAELALDASLGDVSPAGPGRQVRVVLRRHGRDHVVRCDALVLACGALATPYFVRRFRLGPAWRLAGDGLTVHPASKLFALFGEAVGARGVPQGAGWTDPALPAVRFEGVYTPPELAAVTLPLEGRALRRWLDRFENVATFGVMVADGARGRVRYPLGPRWPLIRYDLAGSDALRLETALLRLGRIFFAAGAERVLLPFVDPPNDFGSTDELHPREPLLRPSRLQLMAFHPLGTCAFGRVCDWRGRVADGVYLADGSTVPGPLGVNPQLTIYALALRLADHLLGGRLPTAVAP